MSNAQIKSLNFAVICSFKKIFDVRSTDVAVECMKMFDCREMSEVIAGWKLRFFLERDMLNLKVQFVWHVTNIW